MMRGSGLALAVVVASWSGVAMAQSRDCNDPQNQMEMNFCAQQDWQEQDARLNAE